MDNALPSHPTPSQWLARLEHPDDAFRSRLREVYGRDPSVIDARVALIRRVVQTFLARFGDMPVALFRAPGRINLRGMHVDTHGGYLNLMTHQREVVVAVASRNDDTVAFANVDPQFAETTFRLGAYAAHSAFSGDWLSYIVHPEIRDEVVADRGGWGHYIKGAFLSVQHRFPGEPLRGMDGVIGSDVPRGAALSSSAALCVAVTIAAQSGIGRALDSASLILAARDAEWFTGSRCGLSDQAAIVLGGPNTFVNIALYPPRLDVSAARRVAVPDDVRILVVNSYTERSLSGAAQVDYTRNRFAYSLAMEILRQEMRAHRAPEAVVARIDRLSNVTPSVLEPAGGMLALLQWLKSIPESMSLDTLRARYDLPELDRAYEQCFGGAPPELRPTHFGLRGPLLFGIAESERARLFAERIEQGRYAEAGALMTCGHDGDRRFDRNGQPFVVDVSDAALDGIASDGAAIERFPGAYGASSPALDALVDLALEAGALGASLTGAGMAGTVLVLCRADDAEPIAAHIREGMQSPAYRSAAQRIEPFTADQLAQAVVPNTATASACPLHPA